MKKAGEIIRPRSWAIYGRAGSGKTTLAGSFPGPILLLDVKDEGTDSVSDVDKLDVMEIHEWEDLEKAYWWLVENPTHYKTVVIDTVTQLQQLIVEEISAKKNLKNKAAGDWGTMTKQDWGDVASRMKTWITNFRDLPVETVFIAQDRVFHVEEDDNSDGMIDPEVGPRLSPSIMSHLCAAVSVIGYAFIRTQIQKVKVKGRTREKEVRQYCLRVGPNASYITKFRKPKSISLPDFLIDPDYDKIIETIQGDN